MDKNIKTLLDWAEDSTLVDHLINIAIIATLGLSLFTLLFCVI